MDDFRKYATKHLGMNGMVLDDVIKSQAGYLNPLYSGRKTVECNSARRILPLDDGPHYFPRYTGGRLYC